MLTVVFLYGGNSWALGRGPAWTIPPDRPDMVGQMRSYYRYTRRFGDVDARTARYATIGMFADLMIPPAHSRAAQGS